MLAGPSHSLTTMKSVVRCSPPSMHAKQPRSRSSVSSTSPPSRTRTQHLFGTSPYQTAPSASRSEEHTSELQSRPHLVCRLLLEKKKDPVSAPSVKTNADGDK